MMFSRYFQNNGFNIRFYKLMRPSFSLWIWIPVFLMVSLLTAGFISKPEVAVSSMCDLENSSFKVGAQNSGSNYYISDYESDI